MERIRRDFGQWAGIVNADRATGSGSIRRAAIRGKSLESDSLTVARWFTWDPQTSQSFVRLVNRPTEFAPQPDEAMQAVIFINGNRSPVEMGQPHFLQVTSVLWR